MNTNIDFYSEFKNYAIKHMGVSGLQFHYWETLQSSLYDNVQVGGSLTPYILEEREMRVTQMDIFSRLMMDRILWVAGPVNDQMSTVVSAQLMFLDNLDEGRDITMHVDSPVGLVKSGLSMVDTMNYIASDVMTINTGMAASMGSILLGNGEKGKRFSLPNSKVMLHQVSAGAQGHVEDMKISLEQAVKYNDTLFTMLGEYCGKTKAQVIKDCNRDNWLDAKEALKYGIIDGVIENKGKTEKVMNVAVVGGRTFNDSIHYHRLALVLDILKDGLGSYTIVSGGAIGADSFGERYAKENGLNTIIHLPDWDKHGKAAGMIRNKDIIADADMVVACWDGKSRGTANSIQLAKKANKTTIMIYY